MPSGSARAILPTRDFFNSRRLLPLKFAVVTGPSLHSNTCNYLYFKTTINNAFSQLNKRFDDNSLLLNYEKNSVCPFYLKHLLVIIISTSTKFLAVITGNASPNGRAV